MDHLVFKVAQYIINNPIEIENDERIIRAGVARHIRYQNINEDQIIAIDNSLNSPDVYLVHGPPGTGKTTTLTEIIMHLLSRKKRILVLVLPMQLLTILQFI